MSLKSKLWKVNDGFERTESIHMIQTSALLRATEILWTEWIAYMKWGEVNQTKPPKNTRMKHNKEPTFYFARANNIIQWFHFRFIQHWINTITGERKKPNAKSSNRIHITAVIFRQNQWKRWPSIRWGDHWTPLLPPTPTNHDFLLTTDLMLIIVIQVLGLKVHKYLIICINHFAVVVVGWLEHTAEFVNSFSWRWKHVKLVLNDNQKMTRVAWRPPVWVAPEWMRASLEVFSPSVVTHWWQVGAFGTTSPRAIPPTKE